jgi:hypothetical protein
MPGDEIGLNPLAGENAVGRDRRRDQRRLSIRSQLQRFLGSIKAKRAETRTECSISGVKSLLSFHEPTCQFLSHASVL